MQKGFMNFAFALFTALLLVGNVFAIIATPYPVIIQKPVITSVEGPTSIAEGQAGTWSVTANDPNRNDLSYAVNWGDGKSLERAGQAESGSIARFLHTYSSAGTYTITFTVTNSQGVQAQTTITVNVQGTVANPCTDSDGGNDLFAKGTGNGDYVGSATPVIIGLGSTPWFAQPSPYSYSVFYDYCDQSGQIIEAFCDANGKLSATGSSCPTGYTCSDGACSSNITAINQPPVITGGSAPESLLVNQQGTWSVSAYDPDGTYLSYSVNWGESIITPSPVEQIKTGSSATFQHTYTQAGTYTITFTVTDSAGASAQITETVVVGRGINVNQPPVITSVSGSATLSVGNSGNWKVSAYDPDGTYLSYSVNWGEISIKQTLENSINTGNSASFEHTYSQAGTYTITFTVTDSAGAQTESATTVKVVGSASIGEISASVGAIPTELYQYDSVYVTGKVSRGAAATHDLLQSKSYVVVLTLDNGNVVHPETKATSQSGSIMINQGSITIAPSQGKEEEITLAPGESREVSAYFTASQLGTNFAKLMVYEKIGETCTITDEDHAEENGCQNNYKLVASDTVKVQVKQGDIPNPPSEKITLKFEKGWNQISVPTGYDVSLSDIQKKCDITSAWSYNTALGQYSAATVFGREITGVWMKANAACTYEIDAPYVATGSIPLKTGWNMIGAPSQTTAINNFAGNCKITSGPWNYSPSASQYGYSEKLEPGKGYWVKVSSDCTLGIASDNMPPAAPTN